MMNNTIKFTGRWFGALLILWITLAILPSQASAYTLDIRNPYQQKMQVSIVDFEDEYGKWRTHGWYTVNPLSSRRIQMPRSTQRKNIYLFVETSEAQWSGEGIPSSITRTVISSAFKYYEGQSAPSGANRRQVLFVKYELEDGFLYWSPE